MLGVQRPIQHHLLSLSLYIVMAVAIVLICVEIDIWLNDMPSLSEKEITQSKNYSCSSHGISLAS